MRRQKIQILEEELKQQKERNEYLEKQNIELRNEINIHKNEIEQAQEILHKYNNALKEVCQIKKDYELLLNKLKLEYKKIRINSIKSKLDFFKITHYRKEQNI